MLNFYCLICKQETQIIRGKEVQAVLKSQEGEEKFPWVRNTRVARPVSWEN